MDSMYPYVSTYIDPLIAFPNYLYDDSAASVYGVGISGCNNETILTTTR